MNKKIAVGLSLLLLSLLACEPIFAVGWREIFFVFLLMAFLFGPPLYRFLRKIENFRKHEKKNK